MSSQAQNVRLRALILRELHAKGFCEPCRVEIDARVDGVVHLRGYAATLQQRQAVTAAVRAVPGVKAVFCNIAVRAVPHAAARR